MDSIKSQVKRSFRTEMLAVGLYQSLARQYLKGKPEISAVLKEIASQEHMHGRLFNQYFRNRYQRTIKGEIFWTFTGTLVGQLLHPLPLEEKLKKMSDKEAMAVTRIEQELASGKDPGFLKVLKRILPDEEAHARLYTNYLAGK